MLGVPEYFVPCRNTAVRHAGGKTLKWARPTAELTCTNFPRVCYQPSAYRQLVLIAPFSFTTNFLRIRGNPRLPDTRSHHRSLHLRVLQYGSFKI